MFATVSAVALYCRKEPISPTLFYAFDARKGVDTRVSQPYTSESKRLVLPIEQLVPFSLLIPHALIRGRNWRWQENFDECYLTFQQEDTFVKFVTVLVMKPLSKLSSRRESQLNGLGEGANSHKKGRQC